MYAPAAVLFLVLCWRVLRERRRFSNAVLLGLTALCALVAWLFQLIRSGTVSGTVVAGVLLAVGGLGILLLTGLLFSNGLRMLRKEGRSPANLLSLMAALCVVALIALLIAAAVVRTPIMLGVGAAALGLACYLSFLFLSLLTYAFLYGRLQVRRKADYVVVLGSGLSGGSKVPPLLAGRLDRAREVHTGLTRRGHSPVLITSGGQGPDEDLPESHAMADYLTDRGFPGELIEREDKSTTTEENLRYSKAIMERGTPGYRCVVVTNNYHAFRAALTARRLGIRGQVVGAPTARYFWPNATIREFAALLVAYKRTNAVICLLFVAAGVAVWALR
ncbi:YdcF family protein [Streptomyces sp. CC224B]|uniref:YdcF family protein n=1 Tax=Streptomyces sp. CC224B TaxID=3044571 RepID=UPI0024A7F87E|nr:YdcF family protein [Streptomyces sp. CC224B]